MSIVQRITNIFSVKIFLECKYNIEERNVFRVHLGLSLISMSMNFDKSLFL